jgi:hypothetical protein
MNHQAAQDRMQAMGLYNLDEEDATGQGRMLILDRNWKVVEQSPSAGARVSKNRTILLSSEKYSDAAVDAGVEQETGDDSGTMARQRQADAQGIDLDCSDFAERDFAPMAGDPHMLDFDQDGHAWEN